jgi:hypothetical protein
MVTSPIVKKRCAWCKKIKSMPQINVCCSNICARRKMWADPKFRVKQRAARSKPEFRAKMSRHFRALNKERPELAKASSARMRLRNPMHNPAAKRRAIAAQRARGAEWRPPVRGGNGKKIPLPERLLNAALGAPWTSQLIVATRRPRPWPHHYKIDIAHPTKKIAVEADGRSHCALKRRAADQRRDECLTALG